jgi:putative heme iron utilization protein
VVRAGRSGVLSTHSVKFPGFPYGSALPYVTDQRGRAILLISHLAEHTHNFEADPRASFVVSGAGPNLQADPRVTLLGNVVDVRDELAGKRYLRFYPEQGEFLQLGGFRFVALEPAQVRYIQGFGGLHWLAGDSFLAPDLPLALAEEAILEHMNADHRAALRDYCRHLCGIETEQPEMVGVDCDGFDMRTETALLRIAFQDVVTTPGEVRNALVALARAARS